ncbi:MAG: LysR family transcriptional regulator [Actinobacteria bacterium]|nr:LysR family transcriptional regulator [Actinomycetota bacterium]
MKLYFMQVDPRRLLVLRAVDVHGSVVGAATALRVSPSAVSQQLALLERETGVALIDRARRGGQRPLEFTVAGRRLIAHADRMHEVLDDAAGELATMLVEVTGPVTISAFFTVLRSFVAEALADLAESRPGLRPRIEAIDESGAAEEVQSGAIDIAVVEDDAHRPRRVPRGLRYEPLMDDPFRVAVPIDWPDFDTLADIADRPWVDGPAGSAVGQTLGRLRRETGLAFPAAHSCLEFTAGLAIVGAGIAAAFVPEMALAAAPPPAGVRIQAPPGIGSRRLGMIYRRSRNEPTPAVRAVLDALRRAVNR